MMVLCSGLTLWCTGLLCLLQSDEIGFFGNDIMLWSFGKKEEKGGGGEND